MRPFHALHRAVHKRLEHSPAVREAHDQFLPWAPARPAVGFDTSLALTPGTLVLFVE